MAVELPFNNGLARVPTLNYSGNAQQKISVSPQWLECKTQINWNKNLKRKHTSLEHCSIKQIMVLNS